MLRFLLIVVLSLVFSPASWAEGRYASIIVDADTLDVVHARQIDAPRYPASLTKVMTLHLVFRELIQSVAVRSHNDSAVVLAERLGKTEARFAEMMTAKARSLGMQRTTFKTANGLPHPDQLTTARDMAKLAHSILTTHYDRYHYFGQTHFRGAKNTNALLHDMPDVDGFKTGYTNASGFNLMVSAIRDDRRQIAIVLGGASGKSRNAHMRDLVERGFKVMGVVPRPDAPALILANQSAPTTVLRGAKMRREAKPWAVQLRNMPTQSEAIQTANMIAPNMAPRITSGFVDGFPVFHARVSGLTATDAKSTCAKIQAAQTQTKCWLIAP